MFALDVGPLTVHFGPGVRRIDLDVLDVAARRDGGGAFAALLHALEDIVLDLHVPGVVVLCGLDHGARRRDGITTALHLDGVEEGPVRLVVVGV